jgi:hypothetical protein
MGDRRLAGIAAEDVGRTAFGIFKAGQEYIGKTIGIAGEHLTISEMGATLSKALGFGPVAYNAVEPEVYRKCGFPGADDRGNMFQVFRDFEPDVVGARSIELTRTLNPALQTFEQWVHANRSLIPT